MQGSSLPSTDARRLLTDIRNVNTVPLDNVAVLRLRMLVAHSPSSFLFLSLVVIIIASARGPRERRSKRLGVTIYRNFGKRFKNKLDTEEREMDYSLALALESSRVESIPSISATHSYPIASAMKEIVLVR